MMVITYLIGNGFDINLGLNTRYSDFIEKYRVTNDSDEECVSRLKESINNYWLHKDGEGFDDINWSDTEIAFGQFTKDFKGVKGGDLQIANCHQNLCEELSRHLMNEEKRVDLKTICEQDDFLQTIWNSMLEFPKGLRQDDKSRIVRATADMPGGFDIRIVSFNYTRILEPIVKTINEKRLLGTRTYKNTSYNNSLGPIIHVHGTVEHGMVFGVNDDSQLENSVFLAEEPERKRVMIKPQFNEDMGESTDSNVKKLLAESNIIYIYGMSIGETDKRWWEEIVRLMSINPNIILIVHSIEVPAITLNPRAYTRYQRRFRNRFVGYGSGLSENNIENIRNRIYVTNGNIFECLNGISKETQES